MTFVALDFETANTDPDSACAIGLVRVEGGKIVDRLHRLIRPPAGDFVFTYLHGISPADVEDAPRFPEVWRQVAPVLAGVEFVAAHNADFDRSVLVACCRRYRVPVPSIPFRCTVELARARFGIYPTKLPNVCERLGIALNHHDPLSDAEACAQIVIKAARQGKNRRA